MTSGALAGLEAVTANPAYVTETTVLVLANALAGIVHYAGLRRWAFGRGPALAGASW